MIAVGNRPCNFTHKPPQSTDPVILRTNPRNFRTFPRAGTDRDRGRFARNSTMDIHIARAMENYGCDDITYLHQCCMKTSSRNFEPDAAVPRRRRFNY